MSAIGPVETLARLAMQSDRYVTDRDFRDAVDAVFNMPVFDAAPDLLEALKEAIQLAEVASDWNLNEVEIAGNMVSIYDLIESFQTSVSKAAVRP